METNGWFAFSAGDFSYAFLSVVLEGAPFLLLGTMLSGLIDQFLPSRVMTRWLPRNAYAGIAVSGLLGFVFPMCECGVVPVVRRLIAKGLPVSNAVAYMLAAPLVNPIVALSTATAFRGQGAWEMASLRLGVGWLVAVIVGMAVHNLALHFVVKPSVLLSAFSGGAGAGGDPPISLAGRLHAAMRTAAGDFLGVGVYFVFGVAVASLMGTGVNQTILLPLALDPPVAIASMMGLAVLLSLCSTTDAFIAATFVTFPGVAKLAFMVLGPMLDLKLLFIYSSVFTKRFVLCLALGLPVLVGLICLRLIAIPL